MGPMDIRKRQLAAQLAAQGGLGGAGMGGAGLGAAGLAAPTAARQQALMAGMNAAGAPPPVPPGAPGMGNAAAALGAMGMNIAPPGQPMPGLTGTQGMGLPGPPMMDAGPAPQVGAPPMTGPLSDQIRADYVNSMKAPMQNARVPMNKLATGLQALGAAGTGLAAMGDQGTGPAAAGAGIGAGAAMLGNYLKGRRGRKNLGTSQFAAGGVVKEPQRMAMGGAAKTRKDYPKTGPLPKKNEFAYPLDPVHAGRKARGMGAAVRGHNFKGSL